MRATFKMDAQGVRTKIANGVQRVQFMLDQKVAEDSNFYCPEDVGTLQDSVIASAQSGKGLLIWDEIYAKAQYYERPNKSKDKNPNASMKWFERAKAIRKAIWVRLANAEYNK